MLIEISSQAAAVVVAPLSSNENPKLVSTTFLWGTPSWEPSLGPHVRPPYVPVPSYRYHGDIARYGDMVGMDDMAVIMGDMVTWQVWATWRHEGDMQATWNLGRHDGDMKAT